MLRDKRLVLTGPADADGLAFTIAARALEGGAFVTVVAASDELARWRELVDLLPYGAHAVRADLDDPADVAALREHLRCGLRAVDGAIHAGGRAAPEALAAAVAPLLAASDEPLIPASSGAGAGTACFALGEDAWALAAATVHAPAEATVAATPPAPARRRLRPVAV